MSFRFTNIQAPCMGCTERWANETGRCHTTCERYAEYRKKTAEIRDKRFKESEERADLWRFCTNMKNRRASSSSDKYRLTMQK